MRQAENMAGFVRQEGHVVIVRTDKNAAAGCPAISDAHVEDGDDARVIRSNDPERLDGAFDLAVPVRPRVDILLSTLV